MPNADISYFPNLFSHEEADNFFEALKKDIKWKKEKIKLYGQEHDIPRLTAWYGDSDKNYAYSGIKSKPTVWNPVLLKIKKKVEQVSDATFNSVLLNYYRDGSDSVAWHADDEPELGVNPIIGSVSLGETRQFQMRHKNGTGKKTIPLGHGSYLLMKGTTQHHWQHQIPKSKQQLNERINLTFRIVR